MYDVLEYMAGGMSEVQILADFPNLEAGTPASMSRVCGGSRTAPRRACGVKLLLDENLSPRLVQRLEPVYPGSTHVDHVGLRGKTDAEIWEFAGGENYTIVSKDNDFRQLSVLYGPPPKVVWLSVGNVGTDAIAELLDSPTPSPQLSRHGRFNSPRLHFHDFQERPEVAEIAKAVARELRSSGPIG